MWGGRFERSLLPELEEFASSLDADQYLYHFDLQGSVVHARALQKAGILSGSELAEIERGLQQIRTEFEGRSFAFAETDEDIHTAIDRRLTELTPAGAKLHAGRSRNEQIAFDLRLYCREEAQVATAVLASVVDELAAKAEAYADVPMPGYTHLQRAQVVTVGYHLLAHAEALFRDIDRFAVAYENAEKMPLGSGALAGTTLPLAREAMARELGLARVTENSMDAVSDRDFALDLVYACVSTSIHLSRLAEDIVLWASSEFGFVRLADEIATGSSLMPQKKNPDIAELIRGRAGRSLGAFVALATVLKGLPLTYNRDLQESKESLFAAVDNVLQTGEAAMVLVEHLDFDRERVTAAASDPTLRATDAAEELVRKGTPFHEAHEEIGRLVRDGGFVPPWDVETSIAKRVFGVAKRAHAIRRKVARVKL
ncbi:MAG TPA: argininosuccinate lyase [Candidatus Dormibacteraeota bacterium]|nr:argininosuccinate lyase [Candidatus Dormibacteraeota bacterium]